MRVRRTVLGALVLALAVAVLALAALPFLSPVDDEPFDAGPVVALGGDHRRAMHAATLLAPEAGDRPLLLFAWTDEDVEAAGITCEERHVGCLVPDPMNTFGEARAVAALARDHGWEQVTVVTSANHVTRSRRLFERCLDVPVAVVVGHDLGEVWPVRAARAVRELASWSVSLVVHRDC